MCSILFSTSLLGGQAIETRRSFTSTNGGKMCIYNHSFVDYLRLHETTIANYMSNAITGCFGMYIMQWLNISPS